MIARLDPEVAKRGLRRRRRLSWLGAGHNVPVTTDGAPGARCLGLERRFPKALV
jgi:hypothetical protein